MSPKEDKTQDRKPNNPGSGSGGDGQDQGDRGKDIIPPPPPQGSPKDRAPGKTVVDDDDGDDAVVIVPPPAPAPAPSAGDTGGKQAPAVGGGGEGTSTARGKKRGRPPKAKEPVVADQGAVVLADGERPKKRQEFDAPEVPRPCSVCGKNFNNYKALFGHMRSHPGRLWRGAYPPPISSPTSSLLEIQQQGEQLAASLLSIGERLILGVDPDEVGDDVAGASSSQPSGSVRPRGLDIDLNLEPVVSDPSSPEIVEPEKKLIDLNKEPSDEGEDDDW